jgi:prostaglandin-H2 D-isomerase / glutathione transferase
MKLRFIYFNFPFWRAEASRIALHMGGIPFEDVRPNRQEFLAMKTSGELPYGQLPVLDVDGVRIAQSVAIARFCGKQAGLYPVDDDVAAARVDELLDTATQITAVFGPSMRTKDVEERMRLRTRLSEVTLPKWLGFLEQRLGDGPYFVGEQLTIADLVMWRVMGWLSGGALDGISTDILDDFPGLTRHFQSVDALEPVRSWMASHYPGR